MHIYPTMSVSVLVNPVWGPKVPIKIVIPVIFGLVWFHEVFYLCLWVKYRNPKTVHMLVKLINTFLCDFKISSCSSKIFWSGLYWNVLSPAPLFIISTKYFLFLFCRAMVLSVLFDPRAVRCFICMLWHWSLKHVKGQFYHNTAQTCLKLIGMW